MIMFFRMGSYVNTKAVVGVMFIKCVTSFVYCMTGSMIRVRVGLPLHVLTLVLTRLVTSVKITLCVITSVKVTPCSDITVVVRGLARRGVPFRGTEVLSSIIIIVVKVVFTVTSKRKV